MLFQRNIFEAYISVTPKFFFCKKLSNTPFSIKESNDMGKKLKSKELTKTLTLNLTDDELKVMWNALDVLEAIGTVLDDNDAPDYDSKFETIDKIRKELDLVLNPEPDEWNNDDA